MFTDCCQCVKVILTVWLYFLASTSASSSSLIPNAASVRRKNQKRLSNDLDYDEDDSIMKLQQLKLKGEILELQKINLTLQNEKLMLEIEHLKNL